MIKYIQTIDKYIKTIINKKISKQLPIHLGRWNIEQCNKKTMHHQTCAMPFYAVFRV